MITFSRRQWLSISTCLGTAKLLSSDYQRSAFSQTPFRATAKCVDPNRIKGLLIGSAIGDALGGPIEFRESETISDRVINCRNWDDKRKLTADDLMAFKNSLQLYSYERDRPNAESYGQWSKNAAEGTVTDDTRHKMILMDALQRAEAEQRLPISEQELAAEYLDFSKHASFENHPEYHQLCKDWLNEYWFAARWVMGERDPESSAPTDRIWAGIPTCCGQMTLLPLAAIYSGKPTKAYLAAYALSFFDVGAAKDINSALVAGLSQALCLSVESIGERECWQQVLKTMRSTDPYKYSEIPYVTRPTSHWLQFASDTAKRASGRPKLLYEILEQEGEVKYYWEAHFLLALVFSALEFCDWDALATMALLLDFGHDTDSAAQLLGAYIGALYGPEIFGDGLIDPVESRLKIDYGVSINTWCDLLHELTDSQVYPEVVGRE